MKRIESLTKSQRTEWLNANAVRSYGNVVANASAVKYAILNNSKSEIADWLKSASTTFFPGMDRSLFCSVYEFNRLSEYCHSDNISLDSAFYKISRIGATV